MGIFNVTFFPFFVAKIIYINGGERGVSMLVHGSSETVHNLESHEFSTNPRGGRTSATTVARVRKPAMLAWLLNVTGWYTKFMMFLDEPLCLLTWQDEIGLVCLEERFLVFSTLAGERNFFFSILIKHLF